MTAPVHLTVSYPSAFVWTPSDGVVAGCYRPRKLGDSPAKYGSAPSFQQTAINCDRMGLWCFFAAPTDFVAPATAEPPGRFGPGGRDPVASEAKAPACRASTGSAAARPIDGNGHKALSRQQ